MAEKEKGNKALGPINGDKIFSEEFNKLLDRLNYEAKSRAEVEKKSLEIADKENERSFKLESERLRVQADYYGQKQKNDFKISLILALGGLLFFCALVYFANQGNITVIKDIFFPLLFAIISALGGYGYGMHRARKQQDA